MQRTKGTGSTPPSESLPAAPMNAAEWADRINAQWQKSVEAIIETGRLLIEAKEELGHANGWSSSMFSGRGFEGLVPFTRRTAEMLMEIARNPVLSNAKNSAHLPPVWTTLHQLSTLPDKELQDLIDDGTIHPDMTGKDVGQIPFIMIDKVAKGIHALHTFQTLHRKSAEQVASALAHSKVARDLFSAIPLDGIWHNAPEFALELPRYLGDIIHELYRLHQEAELYQEAEAAA